MRAPMDQKPSESAGRLERAGLILEHASTLEGAARRDYVESACAGDKELRAEVRSLLSARDELGVFMANPTIVAPAFNTNLPEGTPPLLPLLFVTMRRFTSTAWKYARPRRGLS